MKRIFTFALLATVAAMIACTKTPSPEPEPTPTPDPPKDTTSKYDSLPIGIGIDTVRTPHYVLEFLKAENFTTTVKEKSYIHLSYKYNNYCCYYDKNPGFDYAETDRAKKYVELCDRYHDVTYTAVRTFPLYVSEYGFRYLMDNIVSIDVVTETNYDAEHPAGSSLNDICVLEAESPYKHIKSGYTLTHDWPKAEVGQRQKDKGSIPFSKPLTECTAEDMILMGDGAYSLCKIKLEKMPTAGSKQLITITLTEETGKTYTTTTEPFIW